jgi:Ca2+-binding EF-hand superfamily protein
MTKDLLATTFALALTLPAAALAQDAIDADGDGMVTMSEFQDAMPDAEAGTFSQADTDGDGALSADEIAAAQEAGTLPSES